MKWNKTGKDSTNNQTVIRALSFCKKTEDGDIISGLTSPGGSSGSSSKTNELETKTMTSRESAIEKQTSSTSLSPSRSFTSIDLKKSRVRPVPILKRPMKESMVSSTPLVRNVTKSSSFSANDVKPSPIRYELETMTLNRQQPNKSDSSTTKNKLILRVPSIASEYENRKVFYSVKVEDNEDVRRKYEETCRPCRSESLEQKCDSGIQWFSHLHDVNSTDYVSNRILLNNYESVERFNESKNLTDSTTNLVNSSPRIKQKFRHRDFTRGTFVSAITQTDLEKNGIDLNDRLRPQMNGGASDVGSTSLSNFSSGDGLSTPTHMGSTTRLIYNKPSKKWKGSWNESISATFSILALVSNLGNVLRLPRMVYFHGGGIFLLVYILLMLILGIPLTFLEIGLGQFCQHGTTKLWRAINLFRGIGYVKVLISFLGALYYLVYSSVAVSLLTWTAKGPLPFSECQFLNENASLPTVTIGEKCLKSTFLQSVEDDGMWFGVNTMFLLVLWTATFFSLVRRNRTYRRAVFFSLPPTVIIIISLLVEAGSRSTKGLNDLLYLDWSRLPTAEVWYYATVQIFFSLQIGFGNINTSAGRIYPKNNAFWAASSYVICNLCLGILTVILVYMWFGQLETSGLQSSTITVPETLILSVIYDVSVTCMKYLPRLWSSLAYLAVACAGFASVIAFVYAVLVAVAVETKRRWHWWHIAGACSVIGFFAGMFIMIPDYLAVAHILDFYVLSRTVVMVTVLELIGFAWIYGSKNIYNDLEFVIGTRLSNVWAGVWNVAPVYLVIIELWSVFSLSLTGEGTVPDDIWIYTSGWTVYFVCWLVIIAVGIYQIYIQVDYNFKQKFLSSMKPSRNWGPVDPIYRHCWMQWKNRYNLTGQKDFSLKRRGTKDYTHSVRTAVENYDNHSTGGGINPSVSEWTFKRSTSSGPYVLDNRSDHVCWRKDGT